MNFPHIERQECFLPRHPARPLVVMATSVQSQSQAQSLYPRMDILKDVLALQLSNKALCQCLKNKAVVWGLLPLVGSA